MVSCAGVNHRAALYAAAISSNLIQQVGELSMCKTIMPHDKLPSPRLHMLPPSSACSVPGSHPVQYYNTNCYCQTNATHSDHRISETTYIKLQNPSNHNPRSPLTQRIGPTAKCTQIMQPQTK